MKGKPRAIAAILILAAVVWLKIIFFPAIKDDYFALDERNLRHVPGRLLVIRPTRFAFLHDKGFLFVESPTTNHDSSRLMGRDIPFRDLLATAYDANPSSLILPPDAPAGDFDFLATVPDPRKRLQALITKKFHYTAAKQTCEADVLALRIADPRLTGLILSGESEPEDQRFDDFKVHFKHAPIAAITDGLNEFLTLPVLDQTGLTNRYDFSIPYDTATRKKLLNNATARATLDEIVGQLGLKLESDKASLEMLVIKRQN